VGGAKTPIRALRALMGPWAHMSEPAACRGNSAGILLCEFSLVRAKVKCNSIYSMCISYSQAGHRTPPCGNEAVKGQAHTYMRMFMFIFRSRFIICICE